MVWNVRKRSQEPQRGAEGRHRLPARPTGLQRPQSLHTEPQEVKGKPQVAPKSSKEVKPALGPPPIKPLTFTDLVMRAARTQICEGKHKRTPVKIRVRKIET